MTPTLHRSIPLLICMLCASAAPVVSQTLLSDPTKQAGVPASPPDWFKKIDRNGDGKVSREEMPKIFDLIDADKDGIGTVAELTAYFTKAKGKGQTKGATPSPSPSTAPAPGSANPNEPAARGALPDTVEKRAVTI